MKAIRIMKPGGPEVLEMGEWEQPKPGPYEVLVKVAATALNRADTLQRKGLYPPPKGVSPLPGLEMAGEVVGLGAEVSQWKLGDQVCGLLAGGGYAAYVVIHEGLAMPVPTDWSMEEAAAMPEVFLTAFQALHWLAGLEKGERVLIHAGASGVGTAAIQLARQIGASVFVTASKGKHEICQSLGAELAIDYRTESFSEVVGKETAGKGVDVIVDFIGAPYLSDNIETLGMDGRMVLLAFMGGAKAEGLNLGAVLRKRLAIMGSTLRARSLSYKLQLTQDFVETYWPVLAKGEVKPVLDQVFDWSEVAQAHERMEANLNIGKIVLKVS